MKMWKVIDTRKAGKPGTLKYVLFFKNFVRSRIYKHIKTGKKIKTIELEVPINRKRAFHMEDLWTKK